MLLKENMPVKFESKQTNKLSFDEKKQLCALFEKVFNKSMPLERFESKYMKTIPNYSYHGLMIDNGTIVGGYSAIPFKYRYFGRECVFALSVDTMIDEKFRGNVFNLKKMANVVYEALKRDQIPFVFGFPNENIYLVRKKSLKWKDIGELDYYILPIRIGAIKAKLGIFNWLSVLIAMLVNKIPGDIKGKRAEYNIEKVNNDDFLAYRYDNTYKIIRFADKAYFAYKIEVENEAKIAHLIDVFPLSKQMIESSVKHIYENEKGQIDAIAYVGILGSKPINLFKVPKSFEPKRVRMSGRILLDSMIDERVFDIRNWNANLSNFDVR